MVILHQKPVIKDSLHFENEQIMVRIGTANLLNMYLRLNNPPPPPIRILILSEQYVGYLKYKLWYLKWNQWMPIYCKIILPDKQFIIRVLWIERQKRQ